MYYQQFGKKYKNVSSFYDGYNYSSKLEADYARMLDTLKKAKDKTQRVVSWKRQVRVPLEVNGIKVTTYVIDFVVQYADGREEWVETKGMETYAWQIKRNLFQALYPDRIYKVIK